MKKIKKIWMWYYTINKRFLKKSIFFIILLCVPLFTIGMKMMSGDDGGVMKILLYEEGHDEESRKIIQGLIEIEGIVNYVETDNLEKAKEIVRRGKADCLWVFPENFRENFQKYLKTGKPLIRMYLTEDTIQTKIVREQLFGSMYSVLSRELLRSHISDHTYMEDREDIDDEMEKIYKSYETDNSILEFAYMDETKAEDTKTDYLIAPLRGMLSIFMLICSMAVTMFFLQDKEEGILTWMPVRHKKMFSYLYILTGTVDAAVVTWIALYISGSFTTWKRELLLMTIYVFAITGFCNMLTIIFDNVKKLGAGILIITLISLILCPVFVSTKRFLMIQYMLPSFYYLNSLYSVKMLYNMIIYSLGVATFSIILKKI